jgi:urease accessory protein
MFAAASPFEPPARSVSTAGAAPGAGVDPTGALAAIRVRGGVNVAFAARDGTTVLADLEERGGYRAKLPRGGIGTEAVLVNTGGGILGGDDVRFDVAVGPGADATLTTQSAERVYRTLADASRASVHLAVAGGARLAWLPQETILFDGSRMERRIEADVAADGTLLLAEAVVFGRAAMGESVRRGGFRDHWRVRRSGHLVFAEAAAIAGDVQALLQRPALGDGARAMASLLYLAPDAEDRRDEARAALLEASTRAAVSAWNGLLCARFLAHDAAALRRDLVRLVRCLARRAMPRVWNC